MRITSENYVEHVVRTDCEYTPELLSRLLDSARLLHAAMGLVTEAGEFLDMLKKHIYYGKPLDYTNAVEETGDILWYSGLAIDELRMVMNDVMTINIEKLKLRYPSKFTEKHAIERNVEAERGLLEQGYDESIPQFALEESCETASSQRGLDWIAFSSQVLAHIENYTIHQYGDKGEDQVTEWSAKECVEQAKKYLNRFGKNQREGQEQLDFLKAAHYCQLAADKFKEESSEVN
jgi:NTP pyrophosphatase (non-canonical NTP hydrolase)